MRRRGGFATALLAALSAGHRIGPVRSGPDGTRRTRRKRGPINRDQERARRRRQVERGMLKPFGREGDR